MRSDSRATSYSVSVSVTNVAAILPCYPICVLKPITCKLARPIPPGFLNEESSERRDFIDPSYGHEIDILCRFRVSADLATSGARLYTTQQLRGVRRFAVNHAFVFISFRIPERGVSWETYSTPLGTILLDRCLDSTTLSSRSLPNSVSNMHRYIFLRGDGIEAAYVEGINLGRSAKRRYIEINLPSFISFQSMHSSLRRELYLITQEISIVRYAFSINIRTKVQPQRLLCFNTLLCATDSKSRTATAKLSY